MKVLFVIAPLLLLFVAGPADATYLYTYTGNQLDTLVAGDICAGDCRITVSFERSDLLPVNFVNASGMETLPLSLSVTDGVNAINFPDTTPWSLSERGFNVYSTDGTGLPTAWRYLLEGGTDDDGLYLRIFSVAAPGFNVEDGVNLSLGRIGPSINRNFNRDNPGTWRVVALPDRQAVGGQGALETVFGVGLIMLLVLRSRCSRPGGVHALVLSPESLHGPRQYDFRGATGPFRGVIRRCLLSVRPCRGPDAKRVPMHNGDAPGTAYYSHEDGMSIG
jgi:hypothetical protein